MTHKGICSHHCERGTVSLHTRSRRRLMRNQGRPALLSYWLRGGGMEKLQGSPYPHPPGYCEESLYFWGFTSLSYLKSVVYLLYDKPWEILKNNRLKSRYSSNIDNWWKQASISEKEEWKKRDGEWEIEKVRKKETLVAVTIAVLWSRTLYLWRKKNPDPTVMKTGCRSYSYQIRPNKTHPQLFSFNTEN